MRICIDGTALLLRSAGVKNYLYYWIDHLARLDPAPQLSLYPFFGRVGELNHEGSQAGLGRTVAGLAWMHLVNRCPLPLLDWTGRGWDVFHASLHSARPPRRTLLTATVHDMTGWLMPQYHIAGNVNAERRYAERILKRADGLIAVSEHTRQDAIRLLGIPPERIRVIYPGVAEAFFEAGPEQARAVRERYGLARQYVLFVGTIEPRKNVGRLLDAYCGLPEPLRREHELVLAGPAGWGDLATVARLRAGIPGVRYLGYIPEAHLPGLTAGASLLAYPSLYEGFGFPVAQALAAGVPVLTSNVSSLPEVAGPAAVLVEPESVEGIREGLEAAIDAPGLLEKLRGRSRIQAAGFHWSRYARETVEYWRELLRGHRE